MDFLLNRLERVFRLYPICPKVVKFGGWLSWCPVTEKQR